MISYAIEAAINSGVFDKVFVNSEHNVFSKVAAQYETDFYLRPEELGSSQARSDDVVADFIQAFPEADVITWVNPIVPLQTGKEVAETVNYFLSNNLDSLITVEKKQVHCDYDNKPINYQRGDIFARTQDLIPIQAFVYSIMMWKAETFIKQYKKNGHAIFCGEFGVYPASKLSSIIIKTREDLLMADAYMKAQQLDGGILHYDPIAEKPEVS